MVRVHVMAAPEQEALAGDEEECEGQILSDHTVVVYHSHSVRVDDGWTCTKCGETSASVENKT